MPRRRILPYDPALKPLARRLRKDGTLAEVLLWRHLRGKQVRGYSFYRQRPIDRYIVDFFCPELMLAIEVDGSSHDQKGAEDLERQQRLESLGVHVLRFEDGEVRHRIDDVLIGIDRWIEQAASEAD
ncbi:endonuclease domain-containing protein [Rubrivirga sp. IMCC45206]|uniref:endonuclease domain-containing protein n=1 Tax=Rubrivirga sp. IMCC45206 TaxID=3391614 RepID=UPI00398FD725